MKRFDYAISFAGTERGIARELARGLAATGLRVFFDEHFEHEMLGQDGSDYLNNIFFEESQYCVALISSSYEQRAWTRLERRAALAREHVSGPGFLLPVLVDGTRPPWLLPTRIHYDLDERGLADLVTLLHRKHLGNRSEEYSEIWRLTLDALDHPLAIAAACAGEEFFAWCSHVERGRRQLLRIVPDSRVQTWSIEDLPLPHRPRWLLAAGSATLVGVPDSPDEDIIIFSTEGNLMRVVRPDRPYRWRSVTDCKQRDGLVILGYCGGDVWLLDPSSLALTQLRPGTDTVEYVNVDLCGEFAVIAGEQGKIEIRKVTDGTLTAEHALPFAAMGISCFPEAGLLAVNGYNAVATLRLSDGALVTSEEIGSQGTFGESRAASGPILAFVSGMPGPGNALELRDTYGGRRLFRKQSGSSDGWSTVAVSATGATAAATVGNEVVFFRKAQP